jgi:hypothetical protein
MPRPAAFDLTTLRAAGWRMHSREHAALVLVGKVLSPLDRALADAAVKRTRGCLLLLKRKGVTLGGGVAEGAIGSWALVER